MLPFWRRIGSSNLKLQEQHGLGVQKTVWRSHPEVVNEVSEEPSSLAQHFMIVSFHFLRPTICTSRTFLPIYRRIC
jgi:hypothetical protein